MSSSSNTQEQNIKDILIKFASYNIKSCWCTENEKTKENFPEYLWVNRSKAFFEFFDGKDFDVFAIQEGHHTSLGDMEERYSEKYSIVGYCSELDKPWKEIKKGDFYGSILAFLVKKDKRIKILSHRRIPLPDGVKHKRIMVELILDIEGRAVYFYNSHFDHLSADSRIESREIELSLFEDGKKYVISSGDKNWFEDKHGKDYFFKPFGSKCLKKLKGDDFINGTFFGHADEPKQFAKKFVTSWDGRMTIDGSNLDFITKSEAIKCGGYNLSYVAFDEKFRYVPDSEITDESGIIGRKRFFSDHGCMSAEFRIQE